MGKGVSQCSFVGIAACARKSPCPACWRRLYERPWSQSAEEWGREIDQTLFPGGYFKEFIFFHKASKTLILADTIINIELDKVTEPRRTATKFTGMYHAYGQVFFGMRLPLLLQRQKAEAAISKIYSWRPQRIMLSHGRCFDADADKVIRRDIRRAAPLRAACPRGSLSSLLTRGRNGNAHVAAERRSAIGTKRTSRHDLLFVRFRGKAH